MRLGRKSHGSLAVLRKSIANSAHLPAISSLAKRIFLPQPRQNDSSREFLLQHRLEIEKHACTQPKMSPTFILARPHRHKSQSLSIRASRTTKIRIPFDSQRPLAPIHRVPFDQKREFQLEIRDPGHKFNLLLRDAWTSAKTSLVPLHFITAEPLEIT